SFGGVTNTDVDAGAVRVGVVVAVATETGAAEIKPYDATFPCNDKLIGAWGFSSVDAAEGANSPFDYDGHGSHTASTAAGNFVEATISGGARAPETIDLSGVAPHANIIAYAGCCTGSALTAAIDQAIADGVDVINYSIGSPSPSDVWNDFDTVGYLAAREAGIFVATSAGNDGPGDATLGSPADAPWLTATAASTHSRTWANDVTFTGGDSALATINGNGFTDGYGPAPVVYAGDFGDALCLAPFPAGTWTSGEIVICDRGQIARVDKSANAAAGGAGGSILANDVDNGLSINADAHSIPTSHITYPDGILLKAWVATGTGHMGTISAGVYVQDPARGDIMAGFTSRGPNRAIDIVSPSVSAPGVDILAAHGQNDAIVWDFSSGTSMASPHVAGAGALLMQEHPTWTPAEIQSALMLTANTAMLDSDEVTPAGPF
ncbi:MAG: S8 family serine peptidase, partial [Actinomycetota bacterium]|nr:S8 family serine peptidase [Actinomycetota bacterium]